VFRKLVFPRKTRNIYYRLHKTAIVMLHRSRERHMLAISYIATLRNYRNSSTHPHVRSAVGIDISQRQPENLELRLDITCDDFRNKYNVQTQLYNKYVRYNLTRAQLQYF
jgi:hypothetical protein